MAGSWIRIPPFNIQSPRCATATIAETHAISNKRSGIFSEDCIYPGIGTVSANPFVLSSIQGQTPKHSSRPPSTPTDARCSIGARDVDDRWLYQPRNLTSSFPTMLSKSHPPSTRSVYRSLRAASGLNRRQILLAHAATRKSPTSSAVSSPSVVSGSDLSGVTRHFATTTGE